MIPWSDVHGLCRIERRPVDDLAAVVRQHAPHLQVTDRGRLPD